MIGFLRGTVFSIHENRVLVDVAGVGYELFMPALDMKQLPVDGSEVLVHVHTVFRDDSISLYGFSSEERRSLFLMLLDVSGVGPRLALAILGEMSSSDLLKALARGEVTALQAVHGVGKKTAARLCVDLRDRAAVLMEQAGEVAGSSPDHVAGGLPGSLDADAISALVNLGWREADAARAVSSVLAKSSSSLTLQQLITGALACLAIKSDGRQAQ